MQTLKSRESERWSTQSIDEAISAFASSRETGLSTKQAQAKIAEFGPNEIQDTEQRNWPAILLAQLKSSLVALLVFAALVSFFVGEAVDAFAVLIIVLLNTALGFWQDFKAEKSLTELKRLAVPETTVLRDGKTQVLSSASIVPGDIVYLQTGYLVPADCRLVELSNLSIDESALTGESLPVDKTTETLGLADAESLADQADMAFAGTMVVRGKALAIVTATGMRTELGRVAASLQAVRSEPSPLQTKLGRLSRTLALIAILVVGLVFLIGVATGQPMELMLMTAIGMAVALVPEGLPAVATVALALGARKMFQHHALIRELPAVETLGSVSVICSDKTGTLTQNKMRVTSLVVGGQRFDLDSQTLLEQDAQRVLHAAALCTDARLQPSGVAVGEPTECALVEAAAKNGFDQQESEQQFPRLADVPFDSVRKRMTTVHTLPDLSQTSALKLSFFSPTVSDSASNTPNENSVAICKGACESVLEVSSQVPVEAVESGLRLMTEKERVSIRKSRDELASQGMRVLAVAVRVDGNSEMFEAQELEHDFIFLGLIGMMDPPRPEAQEAVRLCKSAGIRPIMITGDHPLTALSIAEEVGIVSEGKVLSGRELAGLSPDELNQQIEQVSVFARVAPEDKLRIVGALECKDEVVAMTGDGVNDAPALKQAHVGVAMGITGTDVAKQAADVVLLDDNFATIVDAIKEGRTVYENIRKFIKYAMSGNVGEILVILSALVLGWPLPLLPLQILWVNLVTDGLPGLALAVEPADEAEMRRPPLALHEPLFNRAMLLDLLWIGGFICIASLASASWIANPTTDLDLWRTGVFTVLTMTQMANAFACKSEQSYWTRSHALSNPWLLLAIGSTFVLQLALIYWPPLQSIFHTTSLSLWEFSLCMALSFVVFLLIEARKQLTRNRAR